MCHTLFRTRSLSNSPILPIVCCELLSNIDHPNFGSLPAPFHQEFPGASQKCLFGWISSGSTEASLPQCFRAMAGCALHLCHLPGRCHVSSLCYIQGWEGANGECWQCTNGQGGTWDFPNKKKKGKVFLVGLFFYAGKTQPLLLYTKFMEQPKSGANLEVRRVWTCDQPWSRFRSWPAFVQYIEVGGSSIDSAALRSFWRITC